MTAAPEGVTMKKYDPVSMMEEKYPFNEIEKNIGMLDEGWAKAARAMRTGGAVRIGHKRELRARSLASVKLHLEVWRTRFEAGDTLALLQAIRDCAEENVPLPTWLANGFESVLNDFLKLGGKHSLDIVFGRLSLPTNTPSKAAAAREDWVRGCELWSACWDLAIANEQISSLDMALEIVLNYKDWGVKKRKARTLVTRIDKNQAEHMLNREKQPLARFLEKRCKAST